MLIVGLGNPGKKYEKTRHNAGFFLLDHLAASYGFQFKLESKFSGLVAKGTIHGVECWFLKPTTFMNRSGTSVASLMRYHKLPADQLLVAYDDLDLPVGRTRFKKAGGHGGHNGIRDIIAHLGSNEFSRVRIGIGHPGDRSQVTNYVLSNFSKNEASDIDDAILRIDSGLSYLMDNNEDRAIQAINSQT